MHTGADGFERQGNLPLTSLWLVKIELHSVRRVTEIATRVVWCGKEDRLLCVAQNWGVWCECSSLSSGGSEVQGQPVLYEPKSLYTPPKKYNMEALKYPWTIDWIYKMLNGRK